jgi:hypothetical protein
VKFFAEPRQNRQACTARELVPQETTRENADIAKGVLAGLLLIPLLAIDMVLAVLTGGGNMAPVKFDTR